MIVRIECRIKGISPLMMHRYPMEPVEAIEKKSPEEQAKIAAYLDDNEELFVPVEAMQRAIIAGAVYSKGKGRASLQRDVTSSVQVLGDRLYLGTKKYRVDARPVVVPATKGRIVRYRPIIDQWELSFDLEFDASRITEQQLRKVLDDTGWKVGVLEYRPERKGPYGRFMVTHWKTVD